MKQAALILPLLIPCSILAQCVADAGPDRVKCGGLALPSTTIIGPEAGAIEGFTYAWEAFWQFGTPPFSVTYTESDLLNDPTLANPEVIDVGLNEPVDFILHVTDNDGNTCSDTMTVQFSTYGTHLGYMEISIEQGDSVFLNLGSNLDGGIPPLQYLWRPNHGLTDSTSLSFWAKPEVTTYYYNTITDSAGCVGVAAPLYYVNVHPVSVFEAVAEAAMTIHPNPTNGMLHLELDGSVSGPVLLRIMDTSGRTVLERSVNVGNETLDVSSLSSRMYLYSATASGHLLGQGRLVVE